MNPSPQQIKAARLAAGLTQTQAGAQIGASLKTWQNWEAYVESRSHRKMPYAKWQLFKILTKSEAK